MPPRLLALSATGTDVGKTFVGCALIRALRQRGRAVEAFKPVLSGFTEADAAQSDAGLLLEALGRPLSDLDRMSPLRFAEPLAPPSAARMEGVRLSLDHLERLCRARQAETGEALLILEGAGGVMSPLAEDGLNLDLFERLQAPVLLVGGSYLGAVSHALTAILAVRSRGLSVAGFVVSESVGDNPPLSEMSEGLARFAPGIPVFVALRRESFDAGPLADAL